jgi:hypothetical protein
MTPKTGSPVVFTCQCSRCGKKIPVGEAFVFGDETRPYCEDCMVQVVAEAVALPK